MYSFILLSKGIEIHQQIINEQWINTIPIQQKLIEMYNMFTTAMFL